MTAEIDITKEQRKIILSLLRRFLPDVEVWAYGSRVKWTARTNSDLDLVAFASLAQRRNVSELKDILSDSDLPFLVDLHVWDDVPEKFRSNIEREHAVLQGARESDKGVTATNGWIDTTIGQQATLQRGIDITRVAQRSGIVPVISSGGVSSFHDTAAAVGPGVVLGRKGVVGSVYFAPSDYWPHDTTLWVKDFHGNDRRFVHYFFKWMAPRIATMDVGSANPTLNRNHVHPIEIRWPPLPEQRAIAHILGTLDDKIELNRKMSETLEAMARALFKSWFVDFDPVRAKAEGRDPGLPKPLAALFPNSFEASKIGEIPKGWIASVLPDVIEVNPARPLKKDAVAPYLDMANMPTRGHTPDDVIDRAFGSGMRFKNGDTLVARITPCLENGKTAYVDFLQDDQIGWGSTEYIVLRPKPPLPLEFAYCLARSNEFREFAIQSMTGSSGRQRVPAESLSHYWVVTPCDDIAERFGQTVEPLFSRASNAAREACRLASLRDMLLPKLISGEIRVREAERFVGGRA